jgi:hypothetical protein
LVGFGPNPKALELENFIRRQLEILAERDGFELQRLEAITISFDFNASLANFDHGFPNKPPLSATQGESEGVGQTPDTLRNGRVLKHMFLPAQRCLPLIADPLSEDHQTALYILSHEAAHVFDLAVRARTLESEIIHPAVHPEHPQFLMEIASLCWNEYVACRLTAHIYPEMIKALEENLRLAATRLPVLLNEGNAAFKKTGNHGDALDPIVQGVSDCLKYAAYVIGHCDGIGEELGKLAPVAARVMNSSEKMARLFPDFSDALRRMWDSYGSWENSSVYDYLQLVIRAFLYCGGIALRQTPQGLLVQAIPQKLL